MPALIDSKEMEPIEELERLRARVAMLEHQLAKAFERELLYLEENKRIRNLFYHFVTRTNLKGKL
jgi:hypothetical protein